MLNGCMHMMTELFCSSSPFLFFLNSKFNYGYGSDGQYESPCKIILWSFEPLLIFGDFWLSNYHLPAWRWFKPLLSYGNFTVFKMVFVRHLAFWKDRNFNCQYSLEGLCALLCQISCRLIKPLPIFGYFWFSIWRLSAILFVKVRNFNCQHSSQDQYASPCQILCQSVKPFLRYGHFWLFKMVAVHHLGFVKVWNFNCCRNF